jgi:hypothetical protein
VLPVALLGFAARQFLRKFVPGAGAVLRSAIHLLLALLFTILWFWLLMVLLGAVAGRNAVEFSVRPFLGPAATWQLFQGLTIYAAIAVTVHAEMAIEAARTGSAPDETTDVPRRRAHVFVKQDDAIRPLDADRIVLVRGADDYSEIVTLSGKHLVRTTLASLEQRLGEGFIRVHRSCLVNARHIARAEPEGGGRMLLHMETGEMIRASRAGSKLLRDRVI